MSKPNPERIRAATPLTALRGDDTRFCCSLCEDKQLAYGDLDAWREHDEHDQPITGPAGIIFIDVNHEACLRKIDRHPRLYVQEDGFPGYFPALCEPCAWRAGLDCTHPSLKANGGDGLKVEMTGGWPSGVITCSRGGGCAPPPRRSTKCHGFSTLKLLPGGKTDDG
jgi:hypothetical protein